MNEESFDPVDFRLVMLIHELVCRIISLELHAIVLSFIHWSNMNNVLQAIFGFTVSFCSFVQVLPLLPLMSSAFYSLIDPKSERKSSFSIIKVNASTSKEILVLRTAPLMSMVELSSASSTI